METLVTIRDSLQGARDAMRAGYLKPHRAFFDGPMAVEQYEVMCDHLIVASHPTDYTPVAFFKKGDTFEQVFDIS